MTQTGEKISELRKQWGRRLLILGHHYQRSDVLQHADETGDSLELARKASQRPDAERIVFCGVRFMAETADILTRPDQQVFMPEPDAGCPMANMADADKMISAWKTLEALSPGHLPVVYVNSSVEVKACCGKLGGSACTSSNAGRVFGWVFRQGKRVFFLPDEHLGANTATDLGISDDEVAVFDPRNQGGGLTPEQARNARVVVWKGFCRVHAAFSIKHVEQVRSLHPEAKIIVHPETPKEVLRLCDAHGSTSQIIKYVEAQPDGATVVVGTEQRLVERLAEKYAGRKTILALWPSICTNMSKTTEESLLALMESWPSVNRVQVPAEIARDARKGLETMLAL